MCVGGLKLLKLSVRTLWMTLKYFAHSKRALRKEKYALPSYCKEDSKTPTLKGPAVSLL